MGVKKTDVQYEDVEDHEPLIGAEKAEVKRYGEAKEKREIIAGYRSKIDKGK
jgi:hypothetical protein